MVAERFDLAALLSHVQAVGRAARGGKEPAADASDLPVETERCWWRRLDATHAVTRLGVGRYAAAAYGGLQDSSPRSALLALHARVDGVGPQAWEDESLVQIWLRWADYVVPRADVGVFTLGTMPRDPRSAAALEGLADAVVATLDGGRADSRAARHRLKELPNPSMLHAASATGRVHIRWDARTTEILAAERPPVDEDEARAELARRFLHWYGPVGPTHLAKWAGLTRVDAEATWQNLAPELTAVAYGDRRRWMLSADVETLKDTERPSCVRLLPPGDPCLCLETYPRPRGPDVMGCVFLDGELVGGWRRRKATVTIDPWPSCPPGRMADIETEADGVRNVCARLSSSPGTRQRPLVP